jgi:nitroreductase
MSSDEPTGMDVFTAMRKRRMHRMFADEPVSEEQLERLLYAAGRAPVARADIRHIVVVTDPRLLRTIRQACPGFINNAPAAFAICTDVERAAEAVGPDGVEAVGFLDSGAAAGFLALAAPALGLGICIVTSWTDAAVQAILGLPERVRPDVLVAVGRPVPNPPRAVRRFEPLVHRERYSE